MEIHVLYLHCQLHMATVNKSVSLVEEDDDSTHQVTAMPVLEENFLRELSRQLEETGDSNSVSSRVKGMLTYLTKEVIGEKIK